MTSSPWLHEDPRRRFAWDGISFQVPREWNLSGYSLQREASWVRMEDDNAVRLEMEWTRSRRPVDMERVRQRFAAVGKSLAEAGAETQPAEGLPEGWSAFLYSLPDGRRLLAAFRWIPDSHFFCFFKLHFVSASRRETFRCIRGIASTFQLQGQEVIPWELLDVTFRLNREFRLLETSFQAGRKLMVFEWRLRTLHLWFFSLADLMLKGKSVEAGCVEFLSGFKGFPGAQFRAGDSPGIILSRHRRRYLLGHSEEIARWCFRYHARCVYLAAQNQIALWVFHYRWETDLGHLVLEIGPEGVASGMGTQGGSQPEGQG